MSLPRSLALCLLILLPVQAAVAGHGREHGSDRGKHGPRPKPHQEQRITPGEAGERVRRQTGGRVLGVTPNGDGYRVKVLTPNGEVRQIQVPSH